MTWLKFKILFCIFCLGLAALICKTETVYITNPSRSDGFGAQYQTIIFTAFYAEQKQYQFVYTPFQNMEHNYDNDAAFLTKKELLINLSNYVPLASNYKRVTRLDSYEYIKFAEKNMQLLAQSKALKEIKQRFRANKPVNYFNNDKLNIAVHIRRPNPHDSRLAGADITDQTFLKIINQLKNKYKTEKYLIHIYSQGSAADFKIFVDPNTVLHLNESIEDTFTALALADVLVMSPSSFSYSAALISNGKVYYLPFWHTPLPHWQVVTRGSLASLSTQQDL